MTTTCYQFKSINFRNQTTLIFRLNEFPIWTFKLQYHIKSWIGNNLKWLILPLLESGSINLYIYWLFFSYVSKTCGENRGPTFLFKHKRICRGCFCLSEYRNEVMDFPYLVYNNKFMKSPSSSKSKCYEKSERYYTKHMMTRNIVTMMCNFFSSCIILNGKNWFIICNFTWRSSRTPS